MGVSLTYCVISQYVNQSIVLSTINSYDDVCQLLNKTGWGESHIVVSVIKKTVRDTATCNWGWKSYLSKERRKVWRMLLKLKHKKMTSSVQSSHSVVPDSLRPHGPQHARPPCPSPTPGVYPNSCPSSWWCHPTISSSVVPFSACLQSFPASVSFKLTVQKMTCY